MELRITDTIYLRELNVDKSLSK